MVTSEISILGTSNFVNVNSNPGISCDTNVTQKSTAVYTRVK